MSTRLTNEIRERIAKAVLCHRFNDEITTLAAERAALAEAVYCDLYNKSTREKMGSLPAGWLPETNSIAAQFGENGRGYEMLPFDGELAHAVNRYRSSSPEPVVRRVFDKHVPRCTKVYPDEHRLSKKRAELAERLSNLRASIRDAERQVGTTLSAATTINRLVEIWPEVEPFARLFDAPSPKLLSVPVDRLNELLDLPVKNAA